jgi:outer membrane protein OmpA-like peptidoglycan-associated protein
MRHSATIVTLGLVLNAACASNAPTTQLKDAREAYQDARTSEASELTPDKLYEAKVALDRAEEAHRDDPGSYRERSLAYVAHRQSELAMTHGRIAKARLEERNADVRFADLQSRMLDQSKQQVASAERELAQKDNALQQNAQALKSERTARNAAEERTKAALQSLKDVAKIKEDARGTVITLDGAVLFASGQTQLLAIAEKTLSDVAKVLKELEPGSTVNIVGYTDSVGSNDNNLRLSEQRAQSVRAYLVSQGVDSSKLLAVGRGEDQPIASNDTPEGRANNRRVELIIGQAGTTQGNAMGSVP